MFDGCFEKRTDKEYQRYNHDHSRKVSRRKIGLELEKYPVYKVPGCEDATYDKIPNLKVYDFLREDAELIGIQKILEANAE